MIRSGGGVSEHRLGAEHIKHLNCVRFPVGCAVQIATDLEMACQLSDQMGLDQSSFVVFGLVPWVGKEDVHAIQALHRQHVIQDLDCIMLDDPHIGQMLFFNQFEQSPYAWLMDFAAQKVLFWHKPGNMGGGVSHAKPDFQNQRVLCRLWAKSGRHVQWLPIIEKHEARAKFGQGFGLAAGRAAGSHDITLDRFWKLNPVRRQAATVFRGNSGF